MMKGILVLLLFISFTVVGFAQETEKLSPSNWKMTQAKMLFDDTKVASALEVYFELLDDYPTNDLLNLRIGEAYFSIADYEKAKSFAENALANSLDKEILADIYYCLACSNHKLNNFDIAIINYTFIRTGTSSVDSTIIIKNIAQAKNGKVLIGNSLNCTVENVGENINSEYNEIYPVFSWSSEKLYYTTDRRVKERQEPNAITYLFKKSILEAPINDLGFPLESEIVDEVFTNAKDYILTGVTLMDKGYYIYKHTSEDADAGDIYFLERLDDEDCSAPEKINETVNTSNYEGAASIDFINNRMYYLTNKNNPKQTNSDIFMSLYKRGYHSAGMAVTAINSDFDEKAVYVHPSGDFMVFSSNCEQSMGGYDLFISKNVNGKWQEPINLGYPINSSSDETEFTLSPSGKFAYFSSNRQGGFGRFDIYKVNISDHIANLMGFSPKLLVVQGVVLNNEDDGVETKIRIVNASDEKDSQKIITDNEGSFAFVIKPGKYKVEIKQKTYNLFNEELNFNADSNYLIEKDFILETK